MFDENVVLLFAGSVACRALNGDQSTHEPVLVRFGTDAVMVLPWIYRLIANTKGTVRAVDHAVSSRTSRTNLSQF